VFDLPVGPGDDGIYGATPYHRNFLAVEDDGGQRFGEDDLTSGSTVGKLGDGEWFGRVFFVVCMKLPNGEVEVTVVFKGDTARGKLAFEEGHALIHGCGKRLVDNATVSAPDFAF
jgi:hypothetical protein